MGRSATTVHRRLPLLTALLAALGAGAPVAAQAEVDAATVVFLIRHAEKADDGTADPPLSEAGRARAATLARVLADSRITRVHTTDYRRTRNTAGPVADALGLTPEAYEPGALEALAREIHRAGGRHLVVGHSNTTPEVVELLGGEPGPPIHEATEYDRLYLLTLAPDGTVTTAILRYGAP